MFLTSNKTKKGCTSTHIICACCVCLCTVVHTLSWNIRFNFSLEYLEPFAEKLFKWVWHTLKLQKMQQLTKLPHAKAGGDEVGKALFQLRRWMAVRPLPIFTCGVLTDSLKIRISPTILFTSTILPINKFYSSELFEHWLVPIKEIFSM